MNQDQLKAILEQIDPSTLTSTASFAIYQHGGGADESFIEANEEGLKLFALQLLTAATKVRNALLEGEDKTISLNTEGDWIDVRSDVWIQYVKPISVKAPVLPPKQYNKTLVDRLIPIGCIGVLLIIVSALMIGLGTMIDWLF